MPPFEDWSSERLRRMLEDRVPENLHLDYKDKGSLLSKKKGEDISKNVSAFMNSDGGVLIYGVPEEKDETGTPIPKSDTQQVIGFEKNEVSKEQIEDLITGNISPKPGADLFQISEMNHHQHSVFVVQVQVGVGEVWQAKDKRYYKRFNFKAEPMEHYEIEVIRNRSKGPNLTLTFGFNDKWDETLESWRKTDPSVTLYMGVQNRSDVLVKYALIELFTYKPRTDGNLYHPFNYLRTARIQHDHSLMPSPTPPHEYYQLLWDDSNQNMFFNYVPLFKLADPVQFAKVNLIGECNVFARVQAPGMTPRGYVVIIRETDFGDLTLEVVESTIQIA